MESCRFLLAPFLLPLILASICARGIQPVRYEGAFYEVSGDIESPHVAWATPLSPASRPKALVIAPWYSQRYTVEIDQRLDWDRTIVKTAVRSRLGYDRQAVRSYAMVEGLFQEDVVAELHRALDARYDIIVVGCDWRALPLWAMHDILKRVKEGTGLLLGYHQNGPYLKRLFALPSTEDPAPVTAGVPLQGIANLSAAGNTLKGMKAVRFGKGRVLQFPYPINSRDREFMTPPEHAPARRVDFEAYHLIAVNAIMWCANKGLDLTIANTDWQWEYGAEPAKLTLDCYSEKTIWRAAITIRWMDRDGTTFAVSDVLRKLARGAGKIHVQRPELPGGVWFAMVTVRRDGRSAGRACIPTTVRSPVTIASLTPAKALFRGDEPLAASVRFASPVETGMLHVEVSDALGFVDAVLDLPAKGETTTVRFEIPLPPPRCVWHNINVDFVPENATVPAARGQAECYREWRRPDDRFSLVAWYGPAQESYMDGLINRAFRKAGIDTVYASHVWGEGAAQRCIETVRAGLTVLPYICSVRIPRNSPGPPNVRTPCVEDPDYREDLLSQVSDCARQFRHFCPVAYSLGDENYFAGGRTEYCIGTHSRRFFQNWLRKRYGSIQELNKAWRSAFDAFDKIEPLLLSQARKAGTPAPWIDFRLCMEASWTGIFSDLQDAIETRDPAPKVGHEGSGRIDSFGAFDWWSMLRKLDLFVPYPGQPAGGNLVRSFRNPNTMSSYWYGAYTFSNGGRRITTQEYFPWFCLFQQFNSAWYFNTYGHAAMAHEAGFAPDLRPLPHFVATADACAAIKRGIDLLILNSRAIDDRVAVLYSPTAIHENTFRNRKTSHNAEFNAIGALLDDLSVPYHFLSYADLAGGTACRRNTRLLILSLAHALSDREVEQIHDFVRNGGAVLADLPPGLADEHGFIRETQPFSGVFGSQPNADALQISTLQDVAVQLDTGRDADESLPCSAIRIGNAHASSGTPLAHVDGQPLAIWNENQRAVLLNSTLEGYDRERLTATGALKRRLLHRVIAVLQAEPDSCLRDPDGAPLPSLRIARFANGPMTLYGIMPEDFRATEVRTRQAQLVLRKPSHLYDVKNGRYLGYRSKLAMGLTTCRAEVIAAVPYTVGELKIDTEVERAPPRRKIRIAGSLRTSEGQPVPAQHAIALRLLRPDGTERHGGPRKVRTADGNFEACWFLAVNEPAGLYTVIATDVVSGRETRCWVQL